MQQNNIRQKKPTRRAPISWQMWPVPPGWWLNALNFNDNADTA